MGKPEWEREQRWEEAKEDKRMEDHHDHCATIATMIQLQMICTLGLERMAATYWLPGIIKKGNVSEVPQAC